MTGDRTPVESGQIEEVIRRMLSAHGKLDTDALTVGGGDDLYEHGMTSHAVVNVMLGLEDELDFEFPDRLLIKSTFQTVINLEGALESIGVGAAT